MAAASPVEIPAIGFDLLDCLAGLHTAALLIRWASSTRQGFDLQLSVFFGPFAERASLSRNSFSPSGERGIVVWTCLSASSSVNGG